jgi:hypothetical protein
MLLELIDDLSAKITELDERIEAQLENVPGLGGVCTSCGQPGPDGRCTGCGEPVLGVIARLDEITGIGRGAAQVIVAELGTDMTQFPTPGHAASWAKLTPRAIQSGATSKAGRTGKGNPYLRGATGVAVMTAARTETFLGARYRRHARRRGKQKAIVAGCRTIIEIAWRIIADPGFRYIELGPDHHDQLDPRRKTRDKIRQLEKLNPGMIVTLTPEDGAQMAFPEDQHAVQELTAQGTDEALADRVHPRRLDGRAHDLGAGGLEDGVERGSEVRSAITDQEPDVLEPLAEGESEVAGLLHCPLTGGMRGDAAQMHPAGAVLDEHQHSVECSFVAVHRIRVTWESSPARIPT